MNLRVGQRLAFNRDIKPYLDQLTKLTGRKVVPSDLLSLDETNSIREESIQLLDRSKVQEFRLDFSAKIGVRFERFVKCLYQQNPNPVYLWVDYSNSCGVYKLSSISDFNWKFAYTAVPQGIISLVTDDARDKMVLDFFEDESGEALIDIELYGANWPSCIY